MKTTANSLSLDFTSYTDTGATDVNVCVRAGNVDDKKILEVLNCFLASIGSTIYVRDGRNG